MVEIIGLDFGTTNSLISLVRDNRPLNLTNQEDDLPHPSVVWYQGTEPIVGRPAKKHLSQVATGVVGDIIRSPKAYLGTGASIHVAGVAREPSDVITEILKYLRQDALSRSHGWGLKFDRAIATIPVNLNGRGRREYRDAALKAGLHIVQFVHEPLAALYGFLRSQSDFHRRVAELEGKVALVFDWGGGTLDLTLCRLVGGALIQIQNKGDNNVGGDRFDERLLHHVKNEHAHKHGLTVWPGEMPGAEAKLIAECEFAKITLSKRSTANILVRNYLRSEGPERDLELQLSRDDLVRLTKDLVLAGMGNIDELLKTAGVNIASVALCVATGGMVQMPYIRERLQERFDIARVPMIKNGDRIIAEGAAWIGHDGLRLTLAKPFELLHAGDSYVTLVHEKALLPTENKSFQIPYGVYCTDPRDGHAKLQFTRPRWPGRYLSSDPRDPYATLSVRVDETARPLLERIELEVTFDHDLIATVTARSPLEGDYKSAEIHDLEFGLSLADPSADEGHADDFPDTNDGTNTDLLFARSALDPGSVRLRSNVIDNDHRWDLVPGEIVERYQRRYLDPETHPPQRQIDEKHYYTPCSQCHRFINEINRNGCDRCNAQAIGVQRPQTAAEDNAGLSA